MDRAFAYVSCSEEDSRVKVQKYCRKIYELGYIPICPRFGFVPFLDESNAEDQQGLAQMSMLLLKRCRMVVVCGNRDQYCGSTAYHLYDFRGTDSDQRNQVNDRGGKETDLRCDLFCKHSVWISKRPLGRTPIPRDRA